MMKRALVLWIVVLAFAPLAWAMGGCDQRLSKDEFRARQQDLLRQIQKDIVQQEDLSGATRRDAFSPGAAEGDARQRQAGTAAEIAEA